MSPSAVHRLFTCIHLRTRIASKVSHSCWCFPVEPNLVLLAFSARATCQTVQSASKLHQALLLLLREFAAMLRKAWGDARGVKNESGTHSSSASSPMRCSYCIRHQNPALILIFGILTGIYVRNCWMSVVTWEPPAMGMTQVRRFPITVSKGTDRRSTWTV